MFYRTISGRDYYGYSFHRTYDAACEALEEYFANGEICQAEQPQVAPARDKKLHNGRGVSWAVMFPC